jgi:hypothetical protein
MIIEALHQCDEPASRMEVELGTAGKRVTKIAARQQTVDGMTPLRVGQSQILLHYLDP